MTVYVDHARIPYRRMLMNHMAADSLQELHDMARRLGLRKEWFQMYSIPHYDICEAKRREAIEYGAIPVSSRDLVRMFKRKTSV